MWVYFEAYKTYISKPSMKYGKMEKKWEKKKIGFGRKSSAPKLMPKLDLSFGSRYQNRISVSH